MNPDLQEPLYSQIFNQTEDIMLPTSEYRPTLDDLRQMLRRLQIDLNINIPSHQQQYPLEQCQICSQQVPTINIYSFCCQEHKYCNDCIIQTIKHSTTNFFILKCPSQSCQVQFDQNSPYYNRVSSQEQKLLKKIKINQQILRQGNKKKFCSKPDCQGVVMLETSEIKCLTCGTQYCDRCFDLKHEGECDMQLGYKLQRKNRFRRCPSCRMLVQRNQGCDHMTCLCGNQYCFLCGRNYNRGAHECTIPNDLRWLGKKRWRMERTNQRNMFRLLDYLLTKFQPNPQFPLWKKYIHIWLFMLAYYPLMILSLTLLLCLGLILFTIVMSLFLTFICLLFLFQPLVQIKRLQMPTSRCMLNLGIPRWLVRVLAILMYPINFQIGIYQRLRQIQCENGLQPLRKILRLCGYCFILPCLMLVDEQELQKSIK